MMRDSTMKMIQTAQRPAGFLLLILLAALFLSLSPTDDHMVVFVYDGDTVLLEDGIRIRYVGINTPEIDREGGVHEFMAEEARAVNRRWVEGMSVRLEYDQEKVDAHGRHLVYLFLSDGEMVNASLVRRGLAHVMSIPPNLKYRDLLLKCQREAMAKGVGIWRSLSKIPETRIGNRSAYRFHRPDCLFAERISQKNRRRFRSRFEAFWQGYAPCKRCRP